jgi:anti-sigma-K factor RskA
MNPAEYIASGILETYALGAATPAEKLEVEAMLEKSAEVRAAFEQVQKDLEAYATAHAVEPDEALRSKILGAVSGTKPTNGSAKVIPIQVPAPSRIRTLAIAASVVLVISIAFNILQWKNVTALTAQNQKQDSAMASAQNEKQFYAKEMVDAKMKLDSAITDLNLLRSPMTKSIVLNTQLEGHPMKAVVHWDMKTMQVAVDPMTLPATAADEKYVLWAMVGGKPVNEGSFELNSATGIMKLNTVPEADGFAISLEKSATVASPAGPIYVMGNASSQP